MEHRFHVSSATWINLSVPFFECHLAQQSNSAHPGVNSQIPTPQSGAFWIDWLWAQSNLQPKSIEGGLKGFTEVGKSFWENVLGGNAVFILCLSLILLYSPNLQFPEPRFSHCLHGIYTGVT